MKVILLEDVKSLGKKGDVVKVSDGYARNMLRPKKLCVEATDKNMNELKARKAKEERKAAETKAAAEALAEEIGKGQLLMTLKVGEGGKAFGAISAKEIADAAQTQIGLELDKKKFQLDGSIKELGDYEVKVRLHPEVTALLKLKVVKE